MMKRKTTKKRPIDKSRVKPPEIYVRVEGRAYWRSTYARAHIRVRTGGYQFLTWRDGTRVRTLYLGKKRNS